MYNFFFVILQIQLNQVESVAFGSFAFNNQNVAQTKEYFAWTCVPASPAFRNSAA